MTPEIRAHIDGMTKSGRLAAKTLYHAARFIKPGVTTDEIDQIVHDYMLSNGATPATLGYQGYPKSCCTSLNEVICHGVPDKTVLKEGDIINLDVTTILDGYFGDTSSMFFVGTVSEKARKIIEVARSAMEKGIEVIGPGATTGDIGFAIDKFTTRSGFHAVREIGGHGIGRKFHDEPFVPSFGKKGKGQPLRVWSCITVEPMINETDAPIQEVPIPGSEHFIYLTGDGTLSAQFEHTVLITDSGYEILTLPE
jgi:methionyl aminopeptidase